MPGENNFTDFFKKIKEKSAEKSMQLKDEINKNGTFIRKLKRQSENSEDENKIRKIQKETDVLAQQQQQAENLFKKSSLAESILKGYFTYKMTSLLCNTLINSNSPRYNNQHNHIFRNENEELENEVTGHEVHNERTNNIENIKEHFEQINNEAKEAGLIKEDFFTQEHKDKLMELATISKDITNPAQAELYASKCEELGLDKNEAREFFNKDLVEQEKPKENVYELEK